MHARNRSYPTSVINAIQKWSALQAPVFNSYLFLRISSMLSLCFASSSSLRSWARRASGDSLLESRFHSHKVVVLRRWRTWRPKRCFSNSFVNFFVAPFSIAFALCGLAAAASIERQAQKADGTGTLMRITFGVFPIVTFSVTRAYRHGLYTQR